MKNAHDPSTYLLQYLYEVCLVWPSEATERSIMESDTGKLGIAFFEYCLMVPANRYGFTNGFTGFQLKMVQEVITLVVFTVFAIFYYTNRFIGNTW